jgi:excisionase family DNA binding protein
MTNERYGRRDALTSGFIASYCQVSRTTVRRWIRDGKLAGFRLPSGHYRVHNEDFRAFLERNNIPLREPLFKSKSEKKGGKQ